jgi:hypothetical protein
MEGGLEVTNNDNDGVQVDPPATLWGLGDREAGRIVSYHGSTWLDLMKNRPGKVPHARAGDRADPCCCVRNLALL